MLIASQLLQLTSKKSQKWKSENFGSNEPPESSAFERRHTTNCISACVAPVQARRLSIVPTIDFRPRSARALDCSGNLPSQINWIIGKLPVTDLKSEALMTDLKIKRPLLTDLTFKNPLFCKKQCLLKVLVLKAWYEDFRKALDKIFYNQFATN